MIPAGKLSDLIKVTRKASTPNNDVLVEGWRGRPAAELDAHIKSLLDIADQNMASRWTFFNQKLARLNKEIKEALNEAPEDEGRRTAHLIERNKKENASAIARKDMPKTKTPAIRKELDKAAKQAGKQRQAVKESKFDLDWSRLYTLSSLSKAWQTLQTAAYSIDKVLVDEDTENYVFKAKDGSHITFAGVKGGDLIFDMVAMGSDGTSTKLPFFVQQKDKIGTDLQGIPLSLASPEFTGNLSLHEARAYMSSWRSALDYVSKVVAEAKAPVEDQAIALIAQRIIQKIDKFNKLNKELASVSIEDAIREQLTTGVTKSAFYTLMQRFYPELDEATANAVFDELVQDNSLVKGDSGYRWETASFEVAGVITQTILDQLGGNKFRAMTGAKNFVGDEKGKSLIFDVPSRMTTNKASKVRITLTSGDDYKVEFFSYRKLEMKLIKAVKGIDASQLRAVFERETGLATSLGTMGRESAGVPGYKSYEWRRYLHDKEHTFVKKSDGTKVTLTKGQRFGVRRDDKKVKVITHQLGRKHIFSFGPDKVGKILTKSRPAHKPHGTLKRTRSVPAPITQQVEVPQAEAAKGERPFV